MKTTQMDYIQVLNRKKMAAKSKSLIACIASGGLAVYNMTKLWEAVRGIARFWEMNMLLSGKFERDVVHLSGIVRITDQVSMILLVSGWLIFVLLAQHMYEKHAMRDRLPLGFCQTTAFQLLLLGATLIVGGLFSAFTPDTSFYLQTVTSLVAGGALLILPQRILKAKM